MRDHPPHSQTERPPAHPPLWAPWRIEYIRADKSGPCPFCAAVEGTDDPASLVLERGRLCLTMLNAYPYASGHLMVVPHRHLGGLDGMTSDELSELMRLTARAVRVLATVMTPHGFNIGLNLGSAGGAGIAEHLHMHVVPRWNGDMNFMPVIAGTRVLPEALDATRAALAPAFARLDQPLTTTTEKRS